MKKIFGFILLFASCRTTQNSMTPDNLFLSADKNECGSYEVKSNERSVGYVVKPFVVDLNNKIVYIRLMEHALKTTCANHYDNYYRIYWFFKSRASDTAIRIAMLSYDQTKKLSDWKCGEPDIQGHHSKIARHFNSRFPQYFLYNCATGILKLLEEDD